MALGAIAFASFFPQLKFRDYRGKWWKVAGREEMFFSTWHPAYVLRRPHTIEEFREDVAKWVEESWRKRSMEAGMVLVEQRGML